MMKINLSEINVNSIFKYVTSLLVFVLLWIEE
jgi:hypothetical protein